MRSQSFSETVILGCNLRVSQSCQSEVRQGTKERWSWLFFLAPGQSGPEKPPGGSVQFSCLVVSDSL